MMTATVVGADEVIAALESYYEGRILAVIEAVEQSAVIAMNHARANHERGLAHGAGRFETQTGALVGGIFTQMSEVSDTAIEAEVKSTMEYGPYVEYGTSRSAAYPFMLPALTETENEFRERVRKAVKP